MRKSYELWLLLLTLCVVPEHAWATHPTDWQYWCERAQDPDAIKGALAMDEYECAGNSPLFPPEIACHELSAIKEALIKCQMPKPHTLTSPTVAACEDKAVESDLDDKCSNGNDVNTCHQLNVYQAKEKKCEAQAARRYSGMTTPGMSGEVVVPSVNKCITRIDGLVGLFKYNFRNNCAFPTTLKWCLGEECSTRGFTMQDGIQPGATITYDPAGVIDQSGNSNTRVVFVACRSGDNYDIRSTDAMSAHRKAQCIKRTR